MRIYPVVLFALLPVLSIPVTAGTITIQELATTDKEGDFPVCFNGAGELLPCADGVEPPPTPTTEPPYIGNWSGRIVYDRNYIGNDTCYDADVNLRIDPFNDSLDELVAITVRRDAGGMDIDNISKGIYYTIGYINGRYKPFDIDTNYTLQFNNKGYAEGEWSEQDNDCYGTWSFTND